MKTSEILSWKFFVLDYVILSREAAKNL